MEFDTQQITRLIRHRRSIYPAQYSEEKVPEVIIKEMLENANWAPTHKITEPWRFVVFSGGGLKKIRGFHGRTIQKGDDSQGLL